MVAHNSIDAAWTNGAGIRLRDLPALGAAIERAIVVDNDVTMSAPEGTVFGTGSAGIEIRGYGQGNVILNNRIRGRARAALSVAGQGAGVPGNNTFVLKQSEFTSARLAKLGDTKAQVAGAFRLMFQRPPNEAELRDFTAYAEKHGVANLCRVLFNSNEFLFVE